MTNYCGEARTNYFRVKDLKKFEADLERIPGIDLVQRGVHFAIICTTGEGLPTLDHDDNEIDLPALIAPHLDNDSVAVLIEVGSERVRYLHGYAVAIHPNGETLNINLNDIYREAQEAFGGDVEITYAHY